MHQYLREHAEDFTETVCHGRINPEYAKAYAQTGQNLHTYWAKGRIVAFAQAEMQLDGSYHVHTLCSMPGYGTKLLNHVELYAAKAKNAGVSLEALPSALGFYEKRGYS